MKIKIRSDSVEIDGYVNAVERLSKPLWSRIGNFIERICAGAFKKALARNRDVKILLNHDWNRVLGSTAEGNLELHEDNIGLHARAIITDPEVIEKARAGQLRGWSFGFGDREVENGIEDGMLLRKVRDLNLYEVSILDDRKSPAYPGTLISARSTEGGEEMYFRSEEHIDDVITEKEDEEGQDGATNEGAEDKGDTEDEKKPVEKNGNVNYNVYKDMVKSMKED